MVESMRPAAVIVGSIAGLLVIFAWFRRRGPMRRLPITAIPAGISIIVALALASSALVTLGYQTMSFARANQSEVGRLPAPMPEALVAAARSELRPGETWTLYTSHGRCRDDGLRYFWIAFRLLPNAAECDEVPSVIIAYRIDDLVEALGDVVASGKGWAVIRP